MEHWQNLSLEDIPGEIWKPIKNWEGLYEISNKGRVKSLPKSMPVPDGTIRLTTTKIHKSDIGKRKGKEYCRAKLNRNNGYRKISVHRLVAVHFILNPENKPLINHKDGNKQNNNDWNLEWATHSENTQHAFDNGLSDPIANLPKSVVGVLHGRAKFSEDEIYKIRSRYDMGEKPIVIWKEYSDRVGYSGVVSICVRKNWKHLPEKEVSVI